MNAQSRVSLIVSLAIVALGITLLVGFLVSIVLFSEIKNRILPLGGISVLLVIQGLVLAWIWRAGRTLDARTSGRYTGPTGFSESMREQDRLRAGSDQEISQVDVLTMPVIPIARNIVIAPVSGSIDVSRVQDIQASLFAGITEHHARAAIVDLTGVQNLSSDVVDLFSQTLSAASLMGCRMVLTGISTEIARTLLSQGASLQATTCRDLRAGIVYATELVTTTSQKPAPPNGTPLTFTFQPDRHLGEK